MSVIVVDHLNKKYKIPVHLRVVPPNGDNENISVKSKKELSCFPNPFSKDITISFLQEKSRKTEIAIFDIQGRMIRNIVINNLKPGHQKYIWDGKKNMRKEVIDGIYYISLTMGNINYIKKIVKI
jgi:flagellar hook assembly protein FlgD